MNREEVPKRSREKRIQEIPLEMAQASNTGRAGRGGNGGRGGQGRGGHGRTPSRTVPCKASEVINKLLNKLPLILLLHN
jgi:hypothetical protein